MDKPYENCDQCLRRCPVESLMCENGFRHYAEITGKEYPRKDAADSPDNGNDGSKYRELIRRRRKKRS